MVFILLTIKTISQADSNSLQESINTGDLKHHTQWSRKVTVDEVSGSPDAVSCLHVCCRPGWHEKSALPSFMYVSSQPPLSLSQQADHYAPDIKHDSWLATRLNSTRHTLPKFLCIKLKSSPSDFTASTAKQKTAQLQF